MTLSKRRTALEKARFYALLDTDYVAPDRLVAVAEQIVRGGVVLPQFRAKR
jgi:thiamine monophosphate synthase